MSRDHARGNPSPPPDGLAPAAPALRFPVMPAPDLGPFPSITLRPGDLLTVTLPDGQAVEVDARDNWSIVVHHLDSAGDHVASLEITPEPEPDGPLSSHPSLSAAERNPSMH